MTERTQYVYRCYDAEGRCLYVGRTNDLKRRMREHRHNVSGADLAVTIKATGPLPLAAACRLEAETAEREQPLYGMTPTRRRLIAKGQMRYLDIYPPHRSPRLSGVTA